MKRAWMALLVVCSLTLLAAAGGAPRATAATPALDAPCKAVDVVFAGGSGRAPGEKESHQFYLDFLKGSKALTGGIDFNYYDLGSQSINGHRYPAIGIAPDGSQWWNGQPLIDGTAALGAALSRGGGASRYGRSVNDGVSELESYVRGRIAKCRREGKTPRFIMAGFSQGAQVVGEAYVEKFTDEERKTVVFNALFGDPKLNLPEGVWEALPPGVPACQGRDWSPWRRAVPVCTTSAGSLGARNPYLPAGWQNATGLWCNAHDFVCGSTDNPSDSAGHDKYADGPITQAVLESLTRLGADLKINTGTLAATFRPAPAGNNGLDVVFLIDSTGSMTEEINQAKVFAAKMSTTVKALKGRVALIEYRDAGDTFTARVLSPLNSDTADFQAKLGSISADGGGDSPEAVLHALNTAFDQLDWKSGATKAAVVLTDSNFHDPDVVDGATTASVAKRSLEIDPVNVYPVIPWSTADSYRKLAEATTGQVVVNTGDAETALDKAFTKIATRPVVQLPLDAYYTPVGGTVSFDASSSYSVDSTIVRWDWDFNGDGTFETQNGPAKVDHQYSTAGDVTMQVRATDANGGVASQSVPVHVGTSTGLPERPDPATSVTVTGTGSAATVTWTAATEPTGGWILTIDGIPSGAYTANSREAHVVDLTRDHDLTFGIAPFTKDKSVGEARVAYLAAESPSPAPVTSSESASASPSSAATTPASDHQTPPAVSEAHHPAAGDLARTGGAPLLALMVAVLLIASGAGAIALRRRRPKI